MVEAVQHRKIDGARAERRRRLRTAAVRASDMLIRATHRRGAAVGIQGAAMALELSKGREPLSALELRDALLADQTQLETLLEVANYNHKQHMASKAIVKRLLTIADVVDIVQKTFTFADRVRNLPPADLQAIIAFGRTLPRPVYEIDVRNREALVKAFADNLLGQRN